MNQKVENTDAEAKMLQAKLNEDALKFINHGITSSNLLYMFLFVAIVLATPVLRKYPMPTYTFGAILFLLSIGRIYITKSRKKFKDNKTLWQKLFVSGVILAALFWGIYNAFILTHFNLGWTSFFVMLMTTLICTSNILVLTPNFKLLTSFQAITLIPCIATNFFVVSGLQGMAIGFFFSFVLILFILIGRAQNKEYWYNARERSRLQAMVYAMPGTLSWVSSDLKYLGVNENLAKTYDMEVEDFEGKEIGFTQQNADLKKFAENLFKNKDQIQSSLVEKNQKMFILTARKYNYNKEAIIIGIEITGLTGRK